MILTTEILVFKTNIQSDEDKHQLRNIMGTLPSVNRWNVDTDDIDCVLRIETSELTPTQIIHHITNAGYQCQELD